ncbi:hypothetical protein CLV74_1187 [Donghicola tyrosinivorans]|uniref:Uncharacterized protein n=1 Tax=Donghicola tyrosinivorans TaxID=1652492 RepID=A0A2T0WEF6_9RHOB|nr:hypothetical protein CLV74_1187 [Donghicola tyrosinivorans]
MIANPDIKVELSLSNRMCDLVDMGFDAVFGWANWTIAA